MSIGDQIRTIVRDMDTQVEFLEATITSIDPVEMVIVGDSRRIIQSDLIIIPEALTDYSRFVDIKATGLPGRPDYSDPTTALNSVTELWEGAAPVHIHLHPLDTWEVIQYVITIRNGLEIGDLVFCASVNAGQRYYIIDRAVAG